MSTNEQTETQEVNKNGEKNSETLQFLDNNLTKSSESGKNSVEEPSERNFVAATLSKNEEALQKNENSLENSSEAVDNKESNQTSSTENENSVLSENSDLLTNTKVPQVSSENSVSGEEAMSRSRLGEIARSRALSGSSASRSTLGFTSKIPGELSGQASFKSTKEDVKYWKHREQELLAKIVELEGKLSEKQGKVQSPSDSLGSQGKEKLENEMCGAVVTSKEKENNKSRHQCEKDSHIKHKENYTDLNLKNFKNSEEVINYLKTQNEDLRNALAKMTTILRDKTTMCISQEKKIAALINQVDSLKEVVAITKDLLNIRNMEVQHLSNDITAMETKIDCERQRHNQMLVKMDEAVKLNSELKKEYENQLKLFQHLRDSYEEKILLLSKENFGKKEFPAMESSNKGGPQT